MLYFSHSMRAHLQGIAGAFEESYIHIGRSQHAAKEECHDFLCCREYQGDQCVAAAAIGEVAFALMNAEGRGWRNRSRGTNIKVER